MILPPNNESLYEMEKALRSLKKTFEEENAPLREILDKLDSI